MAAPTLTARQTPEGYYLENGFSMQVAFSEIPDVSIWENEVTPPGVDGGDALDLMNMHVVEWRPMAPRTVKTLTPMSVKGWYDPNLYNQLTDVVNVKQSISLHYPDGSTLVFWGFVQKLDFGSFTEGATPEVTATIIPTNRDPNTRSEEAPVLTSAAGT